MAEPQQVKVEVVHDPWSAKQDEVLKEICDQIPESDFHLIASINQAQDVVRRLAQSRGIEPSAFKLYNFAEQLWRRIKSSPSFLSSGTYGEQQRAKGKSGSWKERSRQWNWQPQTSKQQHQEKPESPKATPRQAIDSELAQNAIEQIKKAQKKTRAYVYLKEWNVKGHFWYKIGITNNPKRRDAEQNVLPVPAKTLALLEVNGADVAKAIEKSLHKLLDRGRVRNAQNREIFELEREQAESIAAALKSFDPPQ